MGGAAAHISRERVESNPVDGPAPFTAVVNHTKHATVADEHNLVIAAVTRMLQKSDVVFTRELRTNHARGFIAILRSYRGGMRSGGQCCRFSAFKHPLRRSGQGGTVWTHGVAIRRFRVEDQDLRDENRSAVLGCRYVPSVEVPAGSW